MTETSYAEDEFHVGPFANVFYALGRLEPLAGISQVDIIQIVVMLETCAKEMERLGLRASAGYTKELVEILEDKYPGGGQGKLHDFITLLRHSLHMEMDATVFFHVGDSDAAYYREPLDGINDDVQNNFGSTLEDFREAARCYALGRSTASVFHSMRAWEVGLIALGRDLKVAAAANKNWQVLLNDIGAAIKAINPSSGPDWKQQQEWYSDAAAQFRYVKDAWRNTVMHVHQSYTQQRAREILFATRAFMCQIAPRLHD